MEKGRTAAICLGLLVAIWLVYGQTRDFDFVTYDDPDYVTENADITRGLSKEGLVYALTTPVMGFYHPVTMISLLVDYDLYGMKARGYHLTNVAIHALSTLLLFGFFQYTTRRAWTSAAAAALFAIHPLHVESVAWIAERKDVLSALFGLGCLWTYAAYARKGSPGFFVASVLLLTVGLLSKSMLVTVPVLLLLVDVWPLNRLELPGIGAGPRPWWDALRPRLVEKIPFFFVAAAAALATLWIQRQAGAMGDKVIEQGSIGFSFANTPSVIVAYARYLAVSLWPSDLSVLYPHPTKPHAGGVPLNGWEVAQALLLLVLISVAVVRLRRRYASVGWLWYLISLLPVIGFIQIGSHFVADRYTYIPSIGLTMIVCFGVAEWVERIAERRRFAVPAAGALCVAVLAAYGVAARIQTRVWQDSVTLYEQGIRVNPRNVLMHYNLGNYLRAHGEIDLAMEHFRKVVQQDPGHFQAHINLGEALAAKEQHAEAVEEYRFALRIKPNNAIAHNNLANSLNQLGRYDEALVHYRAAIAQRTGSPLPHYNLGNFMLKRQRYEEAAAEYRKALALDPDYVGALGNLGNALLSMGKPEEAIPLYRRALEIEPNNAVSTSGLKIALRSAGATGEAAATE